MQWTRRGQVIVPAAQASWIGTHAALPVVLAREGARRLYFSSRDRDNRSHIGFATIRADAGALTPEFSAAAALSPGSLGAFDDAGVTTSCLVEHDGRLWLFYTGWTRGVSVPFYLSTGLAVSDDDGHTFERISAAPLLDRSPVDPYLNASPWVLIEGGLWRMWYVSGVDWVAHPDGPRHRYHIKYADSADGLHWDRRGHVCLDFSGPDEYAFGRPCVVRDGAHYRMWFCSRGAHYRLGYAESADGLSWIRRDEAAGLDVAAAGWDAEMIAYPAVVRAGDGWQMFYNGNDYGRTGIGLAESRG